MDLTTATSPQEHWLLGKGNKLEIALPCPQISSNV